jgi:hypothetical protein
VSPMVVAADLGDEEFATFAELRQLVCEKHEEAPCPLVAVYISPWQQKLLRLEAFEKRRLTNAQARALNFRMVAGTKILIWDGDGMPPCPGCGRPHC